MRAVLRFVLSGLLIIGMSVVGLPDVDVAAQGCTASQVDQGFRQDCDPVPPSEPTRGTLPESTPAVGSESQSKPTSFCNRLVLPGGLTLFIMTEYATSPPSVTFPSSCGQPPPPVLGDPAASLPPIPSPESVFAAAGLPDPEVSISPEVRGLVGLEVWLWYEGDTEASLAPIGLGGWTVSSEMHITEICWDLGRGGEGSVVCASEPGSEEHPARTSWYPRHGTYTVTVTTRWEGTYTLTHPAAPAAVTLPLGPGLTLSGSRPYPVIEIEAVIGPGD
jgi:hypothetical protein